MFRSQPLAVAQLVLNVLALVYCLYVYPYNLVMKKRWKKHSLNTFYLIITTFMVVQQGVMLIEVIIHVQAILQGSLDWRSNRKLSPIVSYIGVPFYGVAGCHLLFYAGHKYRNMVIINQKRRSLDSIYISYIVLMLFAAYMSLSFILTDFVEMDLSLHRILGASLFTACMVSVIGLLEIQLVKTVFKSIHIRPKQGAAGSCKTQFQERLPPRRRQPSIMQDISNNIPRIAKIKLILLISFMMLMGFTAVGMYIWSDLQNETALANYYASMALSVAAWDSNQVLMLLKKLHSSLAQIQKQSNQPTQSMGDSSKTPSEWSAQPSFMQTQGLQSAFIP